MGQNRHPFAAFMRALAALALAVQCFVVETHVDGLAQAPGFEHAAYATAELDAASAPPVCIICLVAAISRTAMLAGAPPVRIVEHTLFFSSAPQRAPLLQTRARRPWQSRAPPILA